MRNHWTNEEIALTRHAWRMYDHNKFERDCRRLIFSACVIITAIIMGVATYAV